MKLARKNLPFLLLLGLGGCADPQDPVLVTSREELAGENCATGGSAIIAGRDLDGNGSLGEDEIESTTYVCRPVSGRTGTTIAGSVSVWNQDDIDAIKGVTTITGDLVLEADAIATLTFPDLETVGGVIRGDGISGVTTLSFPKLTTVQGIDAYVEEGDGDPIAGVGHFELPVLTKATGAISVSVTNGFSAPLLTSAGDVVIELTATEGAAPGGVVLTKLAEVNALRVRMHLATSALDVTALAHVSEELTLDVESVAALPHLVTVGGHLTVLASGALTFPVLTSVDGNLAVGKRVSSLAAPALTIADGLSLTSNGTELTSVSVPELTTLEGSTGGFSVNVGLSIKKTGLTTIAFPKLATVGGPVSIEQTTLLTTISLLNLATVSRQLTVSSNDALTAFELPALATLSYGMSVTSNDELITLTFPATFVPANNPTGSIHIDGNPKLSDCTVADYVTAWTTNGYMFGLSVTHNGNLACTP